MGAVGGLIGTAGGANGTGFAGPSAGMAPVDPFSDQAPRQIQDAYLSNQGALQTQKNLLKALQNQNGIQNQSDVYNQLQGIVSGKGPNPAQAMLNQATGQNVANQAALMAGQRGASSNVGLLARQAAQQGAQTQQQAVGQGATMQAEQALNAMGQAGNIASNQVANQMGATATNAQAQQNEQQQLLNALSGYNATNAGLQANINSSNASLANTAMGGQQAIIGGGLQGAGMAMMAMAEGGEATPAPAGAPAPASSFVNFLKNWSSQKGDSSPTPFQEMGTDTAGGKALNQGSQKFGQGLVSALSKMGGSGPASGGGAAPGMTAMFAGAEGGGIQDHRRGGNVRAKTSEQKAIVQGNSYANDKIPAVLSEGEYVLNREVMGSKNPDIAGPREKLLQAIKAHKMGK